MTDQQETGPFGIFRVLYSLLTWAGVAFMAAVLVWVTWQLFSHTPAGTNRSAQLALVRPTLTALPGLVQPPPPVAITSLPAQCVACHMVGGTGGAVGPDLSHVATTAGERVSDPRYGGAATTAEEYLRESVAEPSAYIVAGFENPAGPETSLMPPYGAWAVLSTDPATFQKLIDYLLTLE
jgi:hypothetical protein